MIFPAALTDDSPHESEVRWAVESSLLYVLRGMRTSLVMTLVHWSDAANFFFDSCCLFLSLDVIQQHLQVLIELSVQILLRSGGLRAKPELPRVNKAPICVSIQRVIRGRFASRRLLSLIGRSRRGESETKVTPEEMGIPTKTITSANPPRLFSYSPTERAISFTPHVYESC